MRARRIVPCLDVKDGRVVKGVRFESLRDAGDPAECAERYASAGGDEIVLLDIAATEEERRTFLCVVRSVADRLFIPFGVGGGVRSVDDAHRLLGAGADRVAVNSAAVARPALIDELAARYGANAVIVAIDAARRPAGGEAGFEVFVRGGKDSTGIDAVSWAREAAERGAGEILLTSKDRDGTLIGYDLEMIRAVAPVARIPVIASGGAGRAEHLAPAIEAGADAVLAASIFHDGTISIAEAKQALAARGIAIRKTEGV